MITKEDHISFLLCEDEMAEPSDYMAINEGYGSHLVKGWGDHMKSSAKSTLNSFAKYETIYNDWQDEKRKLLELIDQHKDKKVSVDFWTKYNAQFVNWQTMYILDNAYLSKVIQKVKDDSFAELVNVDHKSRSVGNLYGRLNKINDLKAIVNKFDTNLKSIVKAAKDSGNNPRSLSAVLSKGVHSFFVTTSRIVRGSE